MTKKTALETVKNYLNAKKIRYDASASDAVWFSLLVPTPEVRESPNRFVSCGFRVQEGRRRILHFSATVMVAEISEESSEDVSAVLMKFQSSELNAGKIILHPDGTVSYALTQFLGPDGSLDIQALAVMVTTAILEIASIFMLRNDVVKVLPLANVTRFGMA